MALINPVDKDLVAEMGTDDTFVIVTVGGVVKRIKKNDAAPLPEVITDAYENTRGELILVVGGGEEE